ncbi:ABC transporter substrate-binding protein [Paenibacillus thermotolerans]|uniref:ABC transporter substrate-binding protein n=1 Tax=Paenibacillus thermotolerans TaxID=3027807 RepID=UPI0023679F21|nr:MULTISPECIES: extracellular solute-binding protein [unclassified Paenibacillus]
MKRMISSAIMLLLVLSLMLSACGGNTAAPPDSTDPGTAEPADTTETAGEETPADVVVEEEVSVNDLMSGKEASGEVTVWTFVAETEEIAKAFMEQYPNIKVNVVNAGWEVHDKLATTLAAGTGAPDIAMVEQGQFPRYVTGDVLEDLLMPPFEAGRYEEFVSEYNWNRWKSIDGAKLYGMPWDVTPGVLYYRSDIYEQLGLPSDPIELSQYMTDPENILAIAQTLKADGKYFMEWGDGPVHWGGDEVGYFDTQMKWTRNTDRLVELLDVTKRGEQLQWSPYVSALWSDEGKAMVKKGELTGIVLGSWGAREIERTWPEQKGKWRATTMPLGIHAGLGGSTFIVPKQAKNKEAAWAFIQWATISEDAWKIWTKYSVQPGWKHIQELDWYINHTNEFLGGQEDYRFYQEVEKNIPARTLNPLDGKAWEIWLEGVQRAIKNNLDSKAIIQEIDENAQKQLKPDIDKILKEEFGQ